MATKQEDHSESQFDRSIGNVLGILHCILILCQISEFKGWMSHHSSIDVNRLLPGYKFALDTLLRLMHDEISGNYSLKLTEDKYLIRARFTGVPLWKLQNRCEKVTLLKNMRRIAKDVLRQSTWNRLNAAMTRLEKELVQPLGQLKDHTTLPKHYKLSSIEDAIRCAAIFQVYIFMNDTRKGYPHGYIQSMLEDPIFKDDDRRNRDYMTEVFEGYKYAVEFLWSRLTPDRINESPLSQLHLAADWKQFDQYFERIRENIIRPIEQQTSTSMGFDATVQLIAESKQMLNALLVPQVSEPHLNERDQVERKFLWYPIELMDASQTTFNGVFPFVTTLTGTVEMRKKVKNTDEVRVIRLKHPVDEEGDENDYSYALLVEVYGSLGLSDASGWLLFFDCCGDYSGTAGAQHEFAERAIRSYQRRNRIDLEEIVVKKKRFLKLMEGRVVLTGQQYKAHEELKKAGMIGDKFGASKGLLMELLAYYLFSQGILEEDNQRIEWSLNRFGEEIDVIVRESDILTFIECKKPEIENPIKQGRDFVSKTKRLLNRGEFKQEWSVSPRTNVRRLFVTWERSSDNVHEGLMKEGIDEVIVLSDESNRSPWLSRRKLDRLKIALDPIRTKRDADSFEETGHSPEIMEW